MSKLKLLCEGRCEPGQVEAGLYAMADEAVTVADESLKDDLDLSQARVASDIARQATRKTTLPRQAADQAAAMEEMKREIDRIR